MTVGQVGRPSRVGRLSDPEQRTQSEFPRFDPLGSRVDQKYTNEGKIMKKSTKFGAALLGAALVVTPIVMTATPASAAVSTKVITYDSAQLKAAGFPKKPNLTSWEPGTATVSPTKAAVGQTVTISGKAPKYTKPGQVLTLQRFFPSDNKGSGEFKDLGITATVKKDRSFEILADLGRVGTWGYRVGYDTNPNNVGDIGGEFISFQFQLTTTP